MAIKIHGNPFSPATQRVLVCLAEKEIEHEFVVIDLMKGEHKAQQFLTLNPFGQVPALEDGDLKLFESRAINQYLANQYGSKGTELVPKDAKKQALTAVWSEVEAHPFDAAAIGLSKELIVKPMFGGAADKAVVEENKEKLAKVLDVYEARLSASKYLGGDSFSLADLNHIPSLNALFTTEIKAVFEARPRVNAWAVDILGRASWKKVLQILKS
ncbi:hypothetical protein M569_05047 [Genlisea aurea]|uniref:glutathione transferase n=1 Tax=Genlisea aurea TaxID=192259 RepID=S8CSD6_9LAMI|nr:hypothetical protein M569_05047 [Genlisea aurea]